MAQPVWSIDEIADNMFRKGDGWSTDRETLSYSFPVNKPSGYSLLNNMVQEFYTLGLEQRSAAMLAFQLWDDVVDIDFENQGSGGNGNIRIMNSDDQGPGSAHAETGNDFGDIWIDGEIAENHVPALGTSAFKTLIHEIGHTLGLEHPGSYNAGEGDPTYENDAPCMQDSHQYTVMSYFGAFETGAFHTASPQTPLLHDIYAIQQHYGAEMSTRTGDTVYGFNSNTGNGIYDFELNSTPVLCIWDAGGTDELNLSGDANDVDITLAEGGFTSAMGMRWNISIAYGAKIENARGGSGDDRVVGNTMANTLRGNDGADRLFGLDGDDYLIGGGGADVLFGHTGADDLYGSDGADDLHGWTGGDLLDGGANDDHLNGGDGNDTLHGGTGDDILKGGLGYDQFFGDGGFDVADFSYSGAHWLIILDPSNGPATASDGGDGELLDSIEGAIGGDGDDRFFGGAGNNSFDGGDGDDDFHALGGDNELDGGEGEDTFYRNGGNNLIDGGDGYSDHLDCTATGHSVKILLYNSFGGQTVYDAAGSANDEYDRIQNIEFVTGTWFDDRIEGNLQLNHLKGLNGDDVLRGWEGNDTLMGDAGDDRLEGDGGNDTLNGGAGYDIASYIGRYAGVTIDLEDEGLHVITGGGGSDLFVSIEGLAGSEYADTLSGTGGHNILEGNGGNDWLEGRGGSDDMVGGEGNDDLDGGTSNDNLNGGDGNDRLDGGSGNDLLEGEGGNDILTGGTGNDTLIGWLGFDTANYTGATGYVIVDLAVTGAQEIGGGQGSDTLSSIDAVAGSGYGDDLRGTSDGDKLYGLGGNDLLEGRGGNDILDGGFGTDWASYESAGSRVVVDLNSDVPQNTQGAGVDSFISIEALRGSAFDDVLTGTNQDNWLMGLDGHDWLVGGAGDDWLRGNEGDDWLFGGADDDWLLGDSGIDTASYALAVAGVAVTLTVETSQNTGGAGVDRLFDIENLAGSVFADILEGNSSDNTIIGLGGGDVIIGGIGRDNLSGGAGADAFYYFDISESTVAGQGRDTIADFDEDAADIIDLSAIDANENHAGNNDFTFIGDAAFSGRGQIRAYEQDGNTVLAMNTGGGTGADMRIFLSGTQTLDALDFNL